MLMIVLKKKKSSKGDIQCQDGVSYFKCGGQKFLTQKVILSKGLKKRVMLQIFDICPSET